MESARREDAQEILDLYSLVIDVVNASTVRLGWNIEIYPDRSFIDEAIAAGEMCILRKDERIAAAAVVNHKVNPEYDEIDWEIKDPPSKIATIHALAVAPDMRGGSLSYAMLADIERYCRDCGDLAVHLDVIDTNIPAYKLYTRNGYTEVDCIKMYYEVVGTREFWMLEKVL